MSAWLPRLRFSWLLLLLSLSGCSLFSPEPALQTPDVQLKNVRLLNATLLEQEFRLDFVIKNPNNFSLPVRGLAYRVQLNEAELFKGESLQNFTVPAFGNATFSLSAHSNLWRHVRSVRQMLDSPSRPVRYRLDGELKTGFLWGETFPLQRSGQFVPANHSR